MLTLTISEAGVGSTTVTGAGAVHYTGAFGSYGGSTAPSIVSGLAAPHVPSPNVNLSINQYTSNGPPAGLLTVTLTESNITTPIAVSPATLDLKSALSWDVSGLLTVTENTYLNTNDAIGGMGIHLATTSGTNTNQLPQEGGSNTFTPVSTGPGPYSIVEILTAQPTNDSVCTTTACNWLTGATLSVDNVVPEPASLSLLGGSLLAFGAWRRRRNGKAA